MRNLEDLADLLISVRQEGKKIVHCHGVFDLLHIGHIRHFRQAKSYGDVLVVTITPDRFVDKGPGRPAFSQDLRAEAVASVNEVDYVSINAWPTAVETLRLLRPHFYAKGSEFKGPQSDYTGKIDKELEVIEEIGAQVVFTEDIVFSSSNLINRFLSCRPDEVQEYLGLFRQRYSIEYVHDVLNRMGSLKALVIGDAILDEYQYCETIGKSNKDPVLAMQFRSSDLFIGGALAVANQVAGFAGEVKLVTLLGEQESHEGFIRENLHSKVVPHFAVRPGAPTLVKKRFLDGYSFNKLLEIYIMGDSDLPEETDADLCRRMKEEVSKYDLVIAADYGYGAIGRRMVDTLCENAPYLAVNTQSGAGNRGFHTVSRYSRADFVCLSEQDIRLESRTMGGELRPIMENLAERLTCPTMVVTQGQRGCSVRKGKGNFVACPAFAERVVDRVGVGEVFFSVTALAAVLGAEDELIGFLGNVVGSLAVGIIGNQKAIEKKSVEKYVTSLLK
ncbi:MAG TPA: PfkB family carbohydrate kinase [bacterium]|nr:PfkB family carbohydrate kinase [bacterium]